MSAPNTDTGIIAALLQRFDTDRLPFILRLKKKVDAGERLSDGEIEYLKRVLADAKDMRLEPMLERHPEYRSLVGTVFHFYSQVVDRALENESRRAQAD
jgi:hypothetical protein